jgi:hypothetical protein
MADEPISNCSTCNNEIGCSSSELEKVDNGSLKNDVETQMLTKDDFNLVRNLTNRKFFSNFLNSLIVLFISLTFETILTKKS